MKTTGTIEGGTGLWFAPNTGATNESGFTGLPSGMRWHDDGGFFDLSHRAQFWSSADLNTCSAWYLVLAHTRPDLPIGKEDKYSGYSVRCLEGEYLSQPPSTPSTLQPLDGAVNQSINITLSWTCSDPENDPLTYDVYFGITNPPSLISYGQTETYYKPGTLDCSTSYYWKIVAHDDHDNFTEGTIWTFITTNQQAWSCGGTLNDPRDGQSYSTVQIGYQCWMAENINIGTMIQGSNDMANNGVIEKYCYDNNPANCDIYGGLYQWNEMMQYDIVSGAKGICPDGWHLPTNNEWCNLTQFIDSTVNCPDQLSGTDVGIKMKSTTGWNICGNGTNTSGFNALPSGLRSDIANFIVLGDHANFWSSTENTSNYGWYRALTSWDPYVWNAYSTTQCGYSIRCLNDHVTNLPPVAPSDPLPPDGAINIPVDGINISWTCTDPENDPITYDLYFGKENPPFLYFSGGTIPTIYLWT